MKTGKLLTAIREFFDENKKKQRKKKEHLKEVLARLKRKQKKLEQKLDKANNSKVRKRFRKDIAIIRAQRKKGIKFLKSLKNT
ncbi:MAG: hypothetical protein OQL16_11570 [Gammaproteobacteria bacterium]|nr:hypothetical protein [Gammaproteobacteria bacterium]